MMGGRARAKACVLVPCVVCGSHGAEIKSGMRVARSSTDILHLRMVRIGVRVRVRTRLRVSKSGDVGWG